MSEKLAKEAGALFYTMPSELRPDEQIDERLRLAVVYLNSSNWIWTAESCQGHPEEPDLYAPWGHNAEPYLRLVMRGGHLARAVGTLLKTAHDDDSEAIGAPQMKLRTRFLRNGWIELLVYVSAHNVATRNRGCLALERFAFAVGNAREVL